ncbi:hypothetical protein RHOER0001_4086 [Rhodococcus erythropolis SK121]|nr:hypothetical protein RHOER0001_4086 [Rhodococcus erythropolis SK121]
MRAIQYQLHVGNCTNYLWATALLIALCALSPLRSSAA